DLADAIDADMEEDAPPWAGDDVSFEALPDSGPLEGDGEESLAMGEDLPGETLAMPPAEGGKVYVGSIRFGLAAIKNVGEAAMAGAIEEREKSGPFKSLEDFCARVDTKKTSKKSLECLVKCGAFDWTGEERSQLFSEIDASMGAAASAHKDRAAGQVSLFDSFFESAPKPAKKSAAAVPAWSTAEKLAFEKELLGFYVTGHPLDEYRQLLEGGKFVPITKLAEQEDKSTVTIGGALASVEKKFTKKDGKPFAIVVLEDLSGGMEVMIWGEAFGKYSQYLEPGNVVAITGRLDKREEPPRLVANEVKPLKKPEPREKPIVLDFQCGKSTEADLVAVRDILAQSPGKRRVELRFTGGNGRQLRMLPSDAFRVTWNSETEGKLAPWLKR
ncbi:MAG: OB-fold nucleic acid binding domain-containing protein, partial [Verrucomicrobiota bacterium]